MAPLSNDLVSLRFEPDAPSEIAYQALTHSHT